MAAAATDNEHVVLATLHQFRVVAQHSTALLHTTSKRTLGVVQGAAVRNAYDLWHFGIIRVPFEFKAFDSDCHGRLDAYRGTLTDPEAFTASVKIDLQEPEQPVAGRNG